MIKVLHSDPTQSIDQLLTNPKLLVQVINQISPQLLENSDCQTFDDIARCLATNVNDLTSSFDSLVSIITTALVAGWCTIDSVDDEVRGWVVDIASLFHKEVNYPIEIETLDLVFYYCFGLHMNSINDKENLVAELDKHNLPYLLSNLSQQAIDLQLRVLFNYVKESGRPMYALYVLNNKIQNEEQLNKTTEQLKISTQNPKPQQINTTQQSTQVLSDLQQLTFNSKWSEVSISKLQESVNLLINQQVLIQKLKLNSQTLNFSDLMQNYLEQFELYTTSVKQLINIASDEQGLQLVSQNLNDCLKYLCQVYQQLNSIEIETEIDYRLKIFNQFVNTMNQQIIFDTIQLFKKAVSVVESNGTKVILDETINWPEQEPNINLEQLEQILNQTSNEQAQPIIKDCLFTLLQMEVDQYYSLFSSQLSLTNKREAFIAFQSHVPMLDSIIDLINVEQDSELISHYTECKKFSSLIDNIDNKTPSTTINQFKYQLKASNCYDMLVTFFGQYKSNIIKDSCINVLQLEKKLQQAVETCNKEVQIPNTTQLNTQMLNIKMNQYRQIPTENDMNELLILHNQMTQFGEKQVQDNLYVKNIELLYNLAVQQSQAEQQENDILEKAIQNGITLNKTIIENVKAIVALINQYQTQFNQAILLQSEAKKSKDSLQFTEQALDILDQLIFDINYNNHGDYVLPKFDVIYNILFSQVFTNTILNDDYVAQVLQSVNQLIQKLEDLTVQIIQNRNKLLEDQKFYYCNQLIIPTCQHQIQNVVNYINNFQPIATMLIHFNFEENQADEQKLNNLEQELLDIIQKCVQDDEFLLIKNSTDDEKAFIQDRIINIITAYNQLIKTQKQIIPTYINLSIQINSTFNKTNKEQENKQIKDMNDLLEKYEQVAIKYDQLIEVLMGMGKSYEFGFDLTTTCRDKLIKNASNMEVTLDSFQIMQLTKQPNLSLNYQLFNEMKQMLTDLDLSIKQQECGRTNKQQIQQFVRQSVKQLYDVLVKLNPKDITGLDGQQIQENIISRSQMTSTRLSDTQQLTQQFDPNKYVTSQINMIVNHDLTSKTDYVDDYPLQSVQIFDQVCEQIRNDITSQIANKQLTEGTITIIIDNIENISQIINNDIKQMSNYYQMIMNNQMFGEQEYNEFCQLQQYSNAYISLSKYVNQLYQLLHNPKYGIQESKLPTITICDFQQVTQSVAQFQSVANKINKNNKDKLIEKVIQKQENVMYKEYHDDLKQLLKQLSQQQDILSVCSRNILSLVNNYLNNNEGITDDELIDISKEAQEKLIRSSANNDVVNQIKVANKYIIGLVTGKRFVQPFYNKTIQNQAINVYDQTLVMPQSAVCMELIQKFNNSDLFSSQIQSWTQYIQDIVAIIKQINECNNNQQQLILMASIHELVSKLVEYNTETNFIQQKEISETFNAAVDQLQKNESVFEQVKQLAQFDSEILQNLNVQTAQFIQIDEYKQTNTKLSTLLQKILIQKSQTESENIIFVPLFTQINQLFGKYQVEIQSQQQDINNILKEMIIQGNLNLDKDFIEQYTQLCIKAQKDIDQFFLMIQNQCKSNQLSRQMQQQIYQISKKLILFYNSINQYNLSLNRVYDTIVDGYLYKENILQKIKMVYRLLKQSQQQMEDGKTSDLYDNCYENLTVQADKLLKNKQQINQKLQQHKKISFKAFEYLQSQQTQYNIQDDEDVNEWLDKLQEQREQVILVKTQYVQNINIKFQSQILQFITLLLQQTELTLDKVFVDRSIRINEFEIQQETVKHKVMQYLVEYGKKVQEYQQKANQTKQIINTQKLSKEQIKIQNISQQEQSQEINKLLSGFKPSTNEATTKQLNIIDYKLSMALKRWLYSDFENKSNKQIIILGQQLTNLCIAYNKCDSLSQQQIQQQQTQLYLRQVQDYIKKFQQLVQSELQEVSEVLEKKQEYDKQEFDEQLLFIVQGKQILDQLILLTPYYGDYEDDLRAIQKTLFECVNIHFKNCFNQDYLDRKQQLYNVFCNLLLNNMLDSNTQIQQAVQLDGCDYTEKKLIELAKIMQKTIQSTIQSMQVDYKVQIQDELITILEQQTQYNNNKLLLHYNNLSELEINWQNKTINDSQIQLMTTRVMITSIVKNIQESIKSSLPALQCCQALGLWKGVLLQSDLTTSIINQLDICKQELETELQQLLDSHQLFADEEQVQYSATFKQTPLIYQLQIRSLLIAIEAVSQATPIEQIENTNLIGIKFHEKLNKFQLDECYSIVLQLDSNLAQVQQLFEFDKDTKQLILRKPQTWQFFAPSLQLQNGYVSKANNNAQIYTVLNQCYLLTINKSFDTQQPIKQAKIVFTSNYTIEQTVFEVLEQYINTFISDCGKVIEQFTPNAQSHQLLQAITFRPVFEKLINRAYLVQQFMLRLCHEVGVEFSSRISAPNEILKNIFVGQKSIQLLQSTFDQLNYQDKKVLQVNVNTLKNQFNETISKLLQFNNQTNEQIRSLLTKTYLSVQQISKQEANKLFAVMVSAPLFNLPSQNLLSQLVFDDEQFENNFIDEDFAQQCQQFVQSFESLTKVLDETQIDNFVQKKVSILVQQILSSIFNDKEENTQEQELFSTEILYKPVNEISTLISQPWKIQKYIFLSTIGQQISSFYKSGLTLKKLSEQYIEIIGDNDQQQLNDVKLLINQQDMLSKTQIQSSRQLQKQQQKQFSCEIYKQQLSEIRQFFIQEIEQYNKQYNKFYQEGKQQLIDLMQVIITNCQVKYAISQLNTINLQDILELEPNSDEQYQQLHAVLQVLQAYDFQLQQQCGSQELFLSDKQVNQQVRKVLLELKKQLKEVILQFQDVDKEVQQIEQNYSCPFELYRRSLSVYNVSKQSEVEELLEIMGEVKDVSYDSNKIYEVQDVTDKVLKICSVIKREINVEELQENVEDLLEVVRGKN